ncbi:hypothetical protein ACFVGN_39600 [Streptomyces sp. NPDC057757]
MSEQPLTQQTRPAGGVDAGPRIRAGRQDTRIRAGRQDTRIHPGADA